MRRKSIPRYNGGMHGYYLGCPSWGMKTWVGRLFPKGTKQADFLRCYAQVFNTVEGNTTFYALPKAEMIARWNGETPSEFRFCFKFPKKITHEKLLKETAEYTKGFLERVEPLGSKLGTLTLQLPPRFGPKQLERLGAFLRELPKGFRYAVELRHEAFFDAAGSEKAVVDLLTELGIDLVIMDTRGLHTSEDPSTEETRERKPNLPVVVRATGPSPIVRVVPHERFEASRSLIETWLDPMAAWIREGRTPYFFLHAPDDTFAPENAYRFHALLRERADVGELPPWGGAPFDGAQGDLFA